MRIGKFVLKTKKPLSKESGFFCDPAGIRTQGHLIKSQVLYQLSYGIFDLLFSKSAAKVRQFFEKPIKKLFFLKIISLSKKVELKICCIL